MRKILFRGKRADNSEWEYGDLWCNPYGKRVVCIVSPINDQGTTGGNEVDPETVGQFTGLTDKNGVKIFEGDIVQLTDRCNDFEWKAVVIFGNPDRAYCWGWNFVPIDEYKGTTDILLWVEMEDSGAYCEVIGNIYDNPELLENNNLEEHENG